MSWREIPVAEYVATYHEHREKLGVFATNTDPDGFYGSPLVMVEWGIRGEEHPLLRWERRPANQWDPEMITTFRWEEANDER